MIARDAGDIIAILHDLIVQLDRLSKSDLNALNRTLIHVQDHVAGELNQRAGRAN